MPVFDEISQGGVSVLGCALIVYYDIIITTYGPGDYLYNVNKARKGVMEPVVVKEVRLANPLITSGIAVAIYVDTMNALWNESDLVPYSTAHQLAIDYYTALLGQLKTLNKC